MAISAGGSHSSSTRLPSSSSAPMSLTDLGNREPAGEPRRRPPASPAEVDPGSLGGCYRLSRRPGGTLVRHAAPASGYVSVRHVAPATRWLRSGASSIASLSPSMQGSAALRALVALVGLASVGLSSGSRTLGAAVPLPSRPQSPPSGGDDAEGDPALRLWLRPAQSASYARFLTATDTVEDLGAADVAGVDDQVGAAERRHRLRPEQSVGVGDHANSEVIGGRLPKWSHRVAPSRPRTLSPGLLGNRNRGLLEPERDRTRLAMGYPIVPGGSGGRANRGVTERRVPLCPSRRPAPGRWRAPCLVRR